MKSKFKFYSVGGKIRDELLNLKSKDLDLVCVGPQSFNDLEQEIKALGGEIYVSKPEYLTVRCKLPSLGSVDVRLARTDGIYSDGRHPDTVEIATSLEADLSVRDFTVNAMAKDLETGEIIDPFNGREDLKNMRLRCVGDPLKRFEEDKLRIFRGARFCITRGMRIHLDTLEAMIKIGNKTDAFNSVSTERIREEMLKIMRHSSEQAFTEVWELLPFLFRVCFKRGIWFKPTVEE